MKLEDLTPFETVRELRHNYFQPLMGNHNDFASHILYVFCVLFHT